VTVSAKELRFRTSWLFDLLKQGEDIVITYRGTARARLLPIGEKGLGGEKENDEIFGMWADRNEESVDEMVRNLRRERRFDV